MSWPGHAAQLMLTWSEHHPIHQKAVGSIPSQGMHLGCGFDNQSGCIQEGTD